MTNITGTDLSAYDPAARGELVASLCCLPGTGLHLLAVLYKEFSVGLDCWSVRSDKKNSITKKELLQDAEPANKSNFYRACTEINRDCLSLQSLFRAEVDKDTLRDKFISLTSLMETIPVKDEVLIAITSYIGSQVKHPAEIVSAALAASAALQNNLAIEARAVAEQTARRQASGLPIEKTKSAEFLDIAWLAQQNSSFGSSSEIMTNARMLQMYKNHADPTDINITGKDSIVQFWAEGRHAVTDINEESPRKRKEKAAVLVLMDKMDIAPGVQLAMADLAKKISRSIKKDADTVNSNHAERYLAQMMGRQGASLRKPLQLLLSGNLLSPNGKLRPIAVHVARIIEKRPEEAYPGIRYNPSTASMDLVRMIDRLRAEGMGSDAHPST